METSNDDKQKEIPIIEEKERKPEDNWEEYGSDNDNDENEISHNKEETKIVEKVEKKTLIKELLIMI